MSTVDTPNTLDDFSSTVFDVSSSDDVAMMVNTNDLYNSVFSRSVGDLHQITHDVELFSKSLRRSSSVKDIKTVMNEQIVKEVTKWVEETSPITTPSKPSVHSYLYSSKGTKTRTIPLSPSCYRLFRKQHPVIAEELIKQKKTKTPLIKSNTLQIPLKRRWSSSNSLSRKNETSDEISIVASGTLDEYSNSVFIEGDDTTVGSHMSSDFDDYDAEMYDENSTPRVNMAPNPFLIVDKPPSPTVYSLSRSPSRIDSAQESVTFNPLFNSSRAHNFIETRKQPWKIPQNDEISHENPLFRNSFLHRRFIQEKKQWTALDNPKVKRRFFRGQSLTDLLHIV